MNIYPLLWLLVFVLIVAIIWAVLKSFGIAIEPRLQQILTGLVLLIVLVVLIGWLLGLLGYSGPWRLSAP